MGGLALLAAGPGSVLARVDNSPRHLAFRHCHTGEELDVAYHRNGGCSTPAINQLNHLMRDFRTEEVTRMDPNLFDLLYNLKSRAGNEDGVFEIISAYRSPLTNEQLRRKSRGVAKKSFHMQGQALDVRLKGTPTRKLHRLALDLKAGGVGYYRRSDFLHIDTGPVRSW